MSALQRAVLAGLVLVLVPVSAVADSSELVRRGIELMRQGDYDGALTKFRDAQIEDPESPQLHFDIGLALYKLERWGEAEQALSNALFSRDREIEKKAAFHLGNCAFRQGKLQESLQYYDQAIHIDEQYDDARVNREYVTRKIKELARKKQEQQEKQAAERRIIEKLQDLIKKELELHVLTRMSMAAAGQEVSKSAIRRLEEMLRVELPADHQPVARTPEEDEELLVGIGGGQNGILGETRSLIGEVEAKLTAAESQAQQAQGDPASGAMPQDPELPKLVKALPHLSAAPPAMEQSSSAATERLDWSGAHAGQEEALINLLKALDELQDELTLIIQDQVQLLKDTIATRQRTEGDPPLGGDALRGQALQHADVERKLGERTFAFAHGVEEAARTMQAQVQSQQGQVAPAPPGGDPQEQLQRLEAALPHLNQASTSMDAAVAALEKTEVEDGLERENQALEALVKARNALQPPPEGQGQEQKQQDQDQQEQKKDQDQKKGDEGDEESKPDQSQGQDGDDQKSKKEEQPRPLSKEQGEKMLERAEQQERDRRKKNREEMKRAEGAGGQSARKDW